MFEVISLFLKFYQHRMVDNKFYYKLIINDRKYWCFLNKKFKFDEGKMILDFFKKSVIHRLSCFLYTCKPQPWTYYCCYPGRWPPVLLDHVSADFSRWGRGIQIWNCCTPAKGLMLFSGKEIFGGRCGFPGSVWTGIILCRTYIVLKTKPNRPLVLECLLE